MHVRHFLSLLVVPLLAACSHMAQADTDIVGPIWIAEDVGGIPVPQGNDITLTFDLQGRAGGKGGCNTYGAGYKRNGSALTFEQAMSTQMFCAPDALMAQEHAYLNLLAQVKMALGDLDMDGKADLVAPHDNAYVSIHKGTGEAFDAADIYPVTKTPGVRYLHSLTEAKMGYAPDEATALQAHFTNTAPAIADLDGDGRYEVVMAASVQNAAQTDREKGVALWAVRSDASRMPGWDTPLHAPQYLSGLWDLGNTNIVAATNQVSVADLDPGKPGPELVFAGFDGRIHAASAQRQELWSFTYTTDPNVLTGGVVVGDLSGDGVPEVVFASYSTDMGKGALYILDAGGNQLHKLALPRRGAMPVPTLADVNGDSGAAPVPYTAA